MNRWIAIALAVLLGGNGLFMLTSRGTFAVTDAMRPARVNGLPGVILEGADGPTIIAFEPDQTGERIAAIYIMRNPEKLGHVPPSP